MLLEEFSKLTGFTPGNDYYHAHIEPEYIESDLDKISWCKQWVKNGGIQKVYNDLNEVCDIYKNSYENTVNEYRSLRDDYDKLLKEKNDLLEERNEALKKIEDYKKSIELVGEHLSGYIKMYNEVRQELDELKKRHELRTFYIEDELVDKLLEIVNKIKS